MTGPRFGDLFVGREREMAELTAALDDTRAGRGRLVMLVGEPGIGKTRTAEEVAVVARERGTEILWGRCPEERGAPAFWPWVQVMTAHVETITADALRGELGRGAAVLAQAVPAVADKLPGLDPAPPAEDPDAARFRLFDSIAAFLKRASQARPLLVVLDNLHWADGSSLRLLEFLAQEIAAARVLILGTYRDVDISRRHPLFQTLGELTRHRHFSRVILRGLEPGATALIVHAASGTVPSAHLAAAVQRHTDGNPLFVGETLRLLAQEGGLSAEVVKDLAPLNFRLPEGIREVIGRRLNRLSEECSDLLMTATVVGREFSPGLLSRLATRLTEERVASLLEEAEAARVIEELPDRRPAGRDRGRAWAGSYQFTHALIQRTLGEELSLTRRVRLHAEVAQVLETYYGPEADAHAAELAHHFAEAETVLGSEKLVQYSRLAGERALKSFAYEEALAHFHKALAALGGGSMDAERARLTAGAGAANAALRNVAASLADLRLAFDYYVAAGDMDQAAAIAQQKFVSAEGILGMVQVQETALEFVPGDSVSAGFILVRHGRALAGALDEYERGSADVRRGLEIARLRGDRSLELQARSAGAHNDWWNLEMSSAVEHARRVVELTSAIDDPLEASFAYVILASDASERGDDVLLRQYNNASFAAAQRAQNRERLSSVHMMAAHYSYWRGEWDDARRYSDISLGYWEDDPRTLRIRALVEYQVGDFNPGDAYLLRMPRAGWGASFIGLGDWHAERLTGSSRVHGDDAKTRGRQPEAVSRNKGTRGATLVLRACRAISGNTETQESLRTMYAELVTIYRNTVLYADNVPWSGMSWFLGLVARKMGDYARAASHFEESIRLNQKAKRRPTVAWTCLDYADMLLAEGAKNDLVKARSLIETGAGIASELGMQPLAGRFAALKKLAVERRPVGPSYPGGLTEREVEVLRLIATGKSNGEIADALVLSEFTVMRHVSNILGKTGASNRVEAAMYAQRNGLTR